MALGRVWINLFVQVWLNKAVLEDIVWILMSRFEFWAPVCSSWIWVNRGSNQRSLRLKSFRVWWFSAAVEMRFVIIFSEHRRWESIGKFANVRCARRQHNGVKAVFAIAHRLISLNFRKCCPMLYWQGWWLCSPFLYGWKDVFSLNSPLRVCLRLIIACIAFLFKSFYCDWF